MLFLLEAEAIMAKTMNVVNDRLKVVCPEKISKLPSLANSDGVLASG
jgi:hypothetical protein